MEAILTKKKKENPMHHPDFGNTNMGILGICGTTLLYGMSLLTINDGSLIVIHAIASISASCAGFATAIYYIKKAFFDKKKP
jgi:hypothetical protein